MENETQFAGQTTQLSLENKESLLKVARDHPYFALPWFYLLSHSGANNDGEIEKYQRRAGLYFSNTNWLQWQLFLLANPVKDEDEEPVEKMLTVNVNDEASIEHEPDKYQGDFVKQDSNPDILSNNILSTESENVINAGAKELENVSESTQISSLNSNDSNPIEFEPLHTVDYFASQGIKITDEPVSSDKLGKQLKSFTEWIKSMKKIHASQPEVQDPQTDIKIQGIAEGSNIETEVVTEAMADVLVKQEKIAKAIEMYEKLSLNNPSKSAYFAAKIESLKSV
jgi:hypothetical protein